jgi:hypothetical protein
MGIQIKVPVAPLAFFPGRTHEGKMTPVELVGDKEVVVEVGGWRLKVQNSNFEVWKPEIGRGDVVAYSLSSRALEIASNQAVIDENRPSRVVM